MKRIVSFGFQALKQIIDLTVLRKCAQKCLMLQLQRTCFQTLLVVLQSHCKKTKTKDDYPATNTPLESAYLVFIYKNCYNLIEQNDVIQCIQT